MKTTFGLGCAAFVLDLATITNVIAQWSPSRPVRLIVPFPPGGAVDVIGRIVASRLPERLGQQVVVDNRGGANAIIGTELAARAAPDGHTILIVPVGHSITPSVTRKLPYDTLKDFAAIGQIGNGAYVLVVHAGVRATSVNEFVALAKSRPGGLNYAVTGHGNATHLAGELFKTLAGIDMTGVFYKGGGPALTDLIGGQIAAFFKSRPGGLNYAVTGHGNATHLAGELFKTLAGIDMTGVFYKGGGPALTDLIGGQIAAFFSGVASGAAHIKAGRLRALGVTTSRRSGALPDVPTIAEAGLPGYAVDGWYGFLAPSATPPAVIARHHRELSTLVVTADMKQRLLSAGIDAQPSTPAEFQQRIAGDIARWAAVVKKARIIPE